MTRRACFPPPTNLAADTDSHVKPARFSSAEMADFVSHPMGFYILKLVCAGTSMNIGVGGQYKGQLWTLKTEIRVCLTPFSSPFRPQQLPILYAAVAAAHSRQVTAPIGILFCRSLIEVHAQPGTSSTTK